MGFLSFMIILLLFVTILFLIGFGLVAFALSDLYKI